MKNKYSIFVLLFFFAVWQGCGSKTQEATNESIAKAEAEAVSARKSDALAAKKAWLVKASAEKADQRRLAAAEKAKISMTYIDATGKLVYNKAEIDPSYPGGDDAMRKYLKDNLKYPAEALEKCVEGTVFVEFVIDEKGRVREVVATDVVGEDVDLSLKEESVRVVASMTGWNAGLQHGKAVETSFSIPVTFALN